MGRLAARPRCSDLGHMGRLLGPECFLRWGGLLAGLTLGGRAFGRPCATLSQPFGFRLRELFRLGLGRRAKSLNALPDAASGDFVILDVRQPPGLLEPACRSAAAGASPRPQ
jgi:hypothetical protein